MNEVRKNLKQVFGKEIIKSYLKRELLGGKKDRLLKIKKVILIVGGGGKL